jgi:hypothetical protein
MALVQMYTQKGERSWCPNLRRYYSLAATRLTCVRYPLRMDRESAEQWNATPPKRTRVSVIMRSGETIQFGLAAQNDVLEKTMVVRS